MIYNLLIVFLSILYYLIVPRYDHSPFLFLAILVLAIASLVISFINKRKNFKRIIFAVCTFGFFSVLFLTNLGDLLSIGVIYTMNHSAISVLKDHVDENAEFDTQKIDYWLVETKESKITNEDKKVLEEFFNNNPGVKISKGFLFYPIGNDLQSFPHGYVFNLLKNDKMPSGYNDCWNFLYYKINRNWHTFSAACIY